MSAQAQAAVSVRDRIARIERVCAGRWGKMGITPFEHDCLDRWKSEGRLFPRQWEILHDIEDRLFGGRRG